MPDRRTTLFLVGLLAVMTVIPLLHSGYTTSDDVYFALGIGEGWRSPWIFDAQRSGRVQHVFAGQLMPVAYGWGSYWLAKTIGVAAILSNVAALFVLLRVISGDARLGLLAVVCFFAFVQNTWDHNLLTAYPFIISSAFTLFLLASAAWWRALHGRRRLGVLSTVLYGLSLIAYESFIPFAAVFPAMTFMATTGSWRARLLAALRTPHVIVLAGFLVLVVLFRISFYTAEGAAFNAAEEYRINVDPLAISQVLERYAASALPMHYFRVYRDLVNDFYLGYGTFRTRLIDIFGVFEIAWLIKAAVVSFLVVTLTAVRLPVRHRGPIAMIALVLLVLSNLPVAVTEKYQSWVTEYFSHGYLTVYLAFFGVAILLALCLEGAVSAVRARHAGAAKVLVGVLACAVFIVSYGTEFMNAHVAESQRQMYDRWGTVDAWIDSEAFGRLPEGSAVFAPSLWDRHPAQTHVYDDYWTRYVSLHGNKRVQVFRTHAEWDQYVRGSGGTPYFLRLIQERRRSSSYLLFGPVIPGDAGKPMGMTEFALLTHARSDHFRVVGRLYDVDEQCRARLFVNGAPSRGTFDELFAVHIDRPRPGAVWLWTRMSTKGGMVDPESVMVSESTVVVDGAVDLSFGKGFYPDEVAHRWADSEATITLRNRGDRDVVVDVLFELRAPGWSPAQHSRLEVVNGSTHMRWPLDAEFRKRSLRVQVPARDTIDLTFRTDAPAMNLPLDGRRLVLMFLPGVRAQEVGCGHPHERRPA